jgi:hypothetical protein
MEIPYWIIPLVAVIWLTIQYMSSPDASIRSKRLVGGLALASVLIPRFLPVLSLPSSLLQIGICVYLLLAKALKEPPQSSEQALTRPAPAQPDPPAKRTLV